MNDEFTGPTLTTVETVRLDRLEVIDEYEAITDPAHMETRFAEGGDLFHVPPVHRELFTKAVFTGTKWECVIHARSLNSERSAAGTLAREGRVIVRQRTVTYTSWIAIPEEEWDDAQVAL